MDNDGELRILRDRVGDLQRRVDNIDTDRIDQTPNLGIFLAVTTSAITAATGTTPNITPGTGSATLMNWDGTHLAQTGAGITVKNPFTSTMATGKRCVVMIVSGAYFLIAGDC